MKKQKGFSLIELLIVVTIILIVAAIAIPNLLRSKMAANESSAISANRTVTTAEVTYATVYPNVGYSNLLSDLGGTPAACAGGATQTNACLIDEVLANMGTTAKSGYSFTYVSGVPVGGIITTYTMTSQPTNPGTSGQRFFFTDQTGVIRYGMIGAATNASSPIQ